MKAHIELDIADVHLAIKEYVEKRAPTIAVESVVVVSHGATVFEIIDNMLTSPVRHAVVPRNRQLGDRT